MMRSKPGHGRRVLLTSAAVLAAGMQIANAASVGWERPGTLETCLEVRLSAWIREKAELILNEDPAAGDLDDLDVALWAAAALDYCEAQAGHRNEASEHRFSRYMAHWREHIHGVTQTVRQRVRAD